MGILFVRKSVHRNAVDDIAYYRSLWDAEVKAHENTYNDVGKLRADLRIARDAIAQAQKALNVALPPSVEHKVKVGGGE